MPKVKTPKRGEVWDVDFDPPKGAEIGKTRPAVVISEDAIGRLPLSVSKIIEVNSAVLDQPV